jgi:O-antigen/teichoic acid export membrane protein
MTTLRQRVLRAGGWIVGGYAMSQALRLASNLVMTRLLVPEMFGIMAIATMVMVMLTLLSDIGLRQSIVQSRRGEDPVFLDTAWVLQITRGCLLWLAALGISLVLYLGRENGWFPPGSTYAAPVLPAVVAVTAFSAVLLGFQSTRVALAHRGLDQKRPVQIELASQLLALAVMVPLALWTRSIWAMVAGGLVASAATAALSHAWMSGHANRLRWDRTCLAELLHFGKWIFASSALYVLAVCGDRLLLGAFVDAPTLGMYAIALLLVGAVEGGVSRLFQAVSLPALSEIARSDPGRLRETYYRLRVPVDLLLLFLAGMLFAAGQRVIDLLYDPRYAAAGGMLEVLALSFLALRYGVANQIYVALGTPHRQTILHAVRFVSLYALVPPLLWLAGTRAAVWGIALHGLATLPLVFAFNARLGLNDLRREVAVLAALPLGYACGLGVELALRAAGA